MTPRVRLIVSGAVTVAILALVVFGLWAFTAPNSRPTAPPTIQLSPAEMSKRAYNDGLIALSNNQTSTALADFRKAVDLDPKNSAAKTALAKATSSTTTGSSSSGSSSTASSTSKTTTVTPAPANVWTTELKLKPLLPKAFSGYVLGGAEQGASNAADVSGTASNGSAHVQTIEWSVIDKKTSSAAKQFISGVSKKTYPTSSASVAVNDVVDAYYGVTKDGITATVAYVRGRYVFEVLASAPDKKLDQTLAVSAASAFPVKP